MVSVGRVPVSQARPHSRDERDGQLKGQPDMWDSYRLGPWNWLIAMILGVAVFSAVLGWWDGNAFVDILIAGAASVAVILLILSVSLQIRKRRE